MKRSQCGVVAESLTDHDRDELQKFERYLRRRAEYPKEPVTLSYAEVYGDVVFAASPTSTKGKE